jgi:glucose-1-phosphate thymidylyltransferase
MKKGIVLSGGLGTRLMPLTSITNKQLLPIHKRPIIDYSINTLIRLGCTEITVILGGDHFDQIVAYLKDGSDRNIHFNYVYQDKPSGIAQAINLCEPYFNKEEQFAVILGDNLFEKPMVFDKFSNKSAKIALYDTHEINRFGCASIKNEKIIGIEEKPKTLRRDCDANLAITGLYIFTSKFFEYFKILKPSARGEYEITDILSCYLQEQNLQYGFVDGRWLDCGTFETIDSARRLVAETDLENRLL